jgi:type II secretory pathway component PulJ
MRFCIHNPRRRQAAMTLLEIMVASTLLLVIVFGLTAMFNQTQRAFQTGIKQSDVLEGGRAIVELIVRDLEQLRAPQIDAILNAENPAITHLYSAPLGWPNPPVAAPIDNLFGGARGTELHECWFLTQENNRWNTLGYLVRASQDADTDSLRLGYGTLFRYSKDTPATVLTNAGTEFFKPRTADEIIRDFHRVADGLVHFRLWPYDANGLLITNQVSLDELVFAHNNVPSYLELEIGILEPRALQELKGIPNEQRARDYLSRNRHRIHVFRQQVAVRTAPRNP